MINTGELSGKRKVDEVTHYFFSPEVFEDLPLTHQDQFLVLDKESTKSAYSGFKWDMLCGIDDWGNNPFTGGCYETVQKIERWREESDIKKWLYECGVPFKNEAIILPVFKTESDPAILTTWKMITKYPGTYFESDNVLVADPEENWCLYYHHDRKMYFAKGWKYNM